MARGSNVLLADQSPMSEDATPRRLPDELELSVVIPCLDEADTIERCIRIALDTIEANGISGEVIIADNGSTDGSLEIAQRAGARVVPVAAKGYGNALMGGITNARGRYIIMGDADLSYDFCEIPKFLAKLREGNTLVMGCRLETGGGVVEPGAMPFLHRWLGNPFFSYLVQLFFKAPINDVNCGMRGFSREMWYGLDQRCTGMEFAVEMVLKSALKGERIAEVPITLHPDGRINRAPHLRTFRDGWRTLRFYLISSPDWLFMYPGALLIALGTLGYAVALPGLHIGGIGLDVHTLLVATCCILLGYQAVLFSVFAKTFAMTEGLLPPKQQFLEKFKLFNLERGLIAGALVTLLGAGLIGYTFAKWWQADFGSLDSSWGLRLVIPGILLVTTGFQTILSSFLLSLLGMHRKSAR